MKNIRGSRLRAAGLLWPLLLAAPAQTVAAEAWQSVTPGGGGWFEAVGIGIDGLMVAGSDLSGAYISRSSGASWTPVGVSRGLTATHVSAVGMHRSNAQLVFLGTDAGIYRSTDGAVSFTRVQADPYITAIESAPSAPATIYAAGHSGAWDSTTPVIYRSLDSGATWVRTGALTRARIQKLVVHPTQPNVLYAVSARDRATGDPARHDVRPVLLRSSNGGASWTQVAASYGEVWDFAISAANPNDFYLSTSLGVYHSANGGTSWLHTGRNAEIDTWDGNRPKGYRLWLDPADAGVVRLVSNVMTVWGNQGGGIWRGTRSGGAFTWSFVNTGLGSLGTKSGWAMPDYWHYAETRNADLYSGFYHAGESLRTMAIDPRNAARMVFVNDQWVFQTGNGGAGFAQIFTNAAGSGWRSRGFDNVIPYDVAASRWADGASVIIGGYADLGCWRSENQGTSWESCNAPGHTGDWGGKGGNVTTIAIDQQRSGTVWAAMGGTPEQGGRLLRSDRAGRFDSWSVSDAGLAEKSNLWGLSIAPTSPVAQRTLYITANGDVYRSTDDGRNWRKVLSCRDRTRQHNGVEAYCITTAVDQFNGNIVYAGGSAGLFVSRDGGSTWSWADTTRMTGVVNPDSTSTAQSVAELFHAYAGRYFISRIATDPFVPDRAYLAVVDARSGGTRGGVWAATQGMNWQRLYANPYVRAVAASPYTAGELTAVSSYAYGAGGYSTQSLGVLQRSAAGTWSRVNQGLSYYHAGSLAYGNAPGRLVLGAYGQGVMRNWRDAGSTVPTKPVLLAPSGSITTATPAFTWKAAPGATGYRLWVNEYGNPERPGKIDAYLTPAQAGCTTGGTCSAAPGVTFAKAAAEWWITAYFPGNVSMVAGPTAFVRQ